MFAQGPAYPNQRWLLPLGLGLFVLLCDQLSKRWAVAELGPLPYVQRISLGPDWLNLVYTQNTGVAFGLFQNVPQLFTFTSIIITLGVMYVYATYLPNQILWIQIAIGLVCGGAIGNIVDRLRFGHVVDLISVGWFPVFNLADSAISVGVTMLAGYLIFVGDELDVAPRVPPRDDGLLNDLLNRDIDQ